MRRPKVPMQGRGGVHEEARLAQRAAHREKVLREATKADPRSIFTNVREGCDDAIADNKLGMAKRGLCDTHVLAIIPNPRVEFGEANLAINFQCISREEILAHHSGEELAEVRASLQHPPRPGHIWLFMMLPNCRLLLEEPVEHRVVPVPNAPGGVS